MTTCPRCRLRHDGAVPLCDWCAALASRYLKRMKDPMMKPGHAHTNHYRGRPVKRDRA